MESIRQRLVSNLDVRLYKEISGKNTLRFLREQKPLDFLIDIAINVLYSYSRGKREQHRRTMLTEAACAIGHAARSAKGMPVDSGSAVRIGAFVIYTFEVLGIVKAEIGKSNTKRHNAYVLNIIDDGTLQKLWEALPIDKVEKFPSLTKYAPWVSGVHSTGVRMVKTTNDSVIKSLSPETHPILFSSLNKSQEIAWCVNQKVYDIYAWALRNRTEAFSDIWEMSSVEARASKLREANTIGSVAKRLLGLQFYHLYTYDFRGRKYNNTAYFHEQGTDLAKGMILYHKKKTITEQGFFWLMISIASNWGGASGRADGAKTDKIPLEERVHWALDNEEILLSYALAPRLNQGWMKAESPWQFLAACFELAALREWQIEEQASATAEGRVPDLYGYASGLIAYIDGSNNGSQHLAALTRDEETAPLVNLVPTELPGDLYKFVAEHVWQKVMEDIALLTAEERQQCNTVINTIIDKKAAISAAPAKSELRRELIDEMAVYREENKEVIQRASPVFWGRITDDKGKRKICKRGVMVLPYGGTPYGLGEQVMDDARKHGIPLLLAIEQTWASYMGRAIFEDCRQSMKRPSQLLSKFESAGKQAEREERFLSWTVPLTNFPVVQNYIEGEVKRLHVQYGPPLGEKLTTGYYENTYLLAVCFVEDKVRSKRKQGQGAAPNAVHSLDAAHLALTVHRAPFDMTTIHDSFGAALADMPELFILVRETFVELYRADPLSHLLRDIGADYSGIQLGTLNIEDILESEYAFS